MKKQNIFKKIKKENYIILSIVAGIEYIFLFLFIFLIKDAAIVDVCDGLFIITGISLCIAGLIALINFGMFDTLAYGFNTLGHYIFKSNKPRKYDDLIDYKEKVNTKRDDSASSAILYLLLGAFNGIILLVFELVWHSMI